MQPQHEKIVRHIILPDGTIELVAESYFEKKEKELVSHRKTIKTTKTVLLKDIVDALSHLTKDNSPTLQLIIRQDAHGNPFEIIKQWITEKK